MTNRSDVDVTCECVRERPTRIELASSAWKAEVLPLNYGRESGSSLKLYSRPRGHTVRAGGRGGVLRRPGRPLLSRRGRGPPAAAALPRRPERVVSPSRALPHAVLGWSGHLRRRARPSSSAHAPRPLRHRPGGARRLAPPHSRRAARAGVDVAHLGCRRTRVSRLPRDGGELAREFRLTTRSVSL